MSSIEELKGAITSGIARADRYKIMLPSDFGMDGRDLNILCRAANLPGRQILTQERRIGMITQKMPYAFGFNDVSLTFILDNNYSVRNYFDEWQRAVVNPGDYELAYKTEYSKTVSIFQLNHGDDSVVYGCKLLRAFPTTVNAIELGDENENSLVQLNVELSYTDWEPEQV